MKERLCKIDFEFIRRCWQTRSGVAAVEFALILPVLVVILFGLLSIYTVAMSAKYAQHTVFAITDIATRQTSFDDDRFDALAASAEALMQTSPGSNTVTFTMASVIKPTAGTWEDWEIDWQKSYNGASPLTLEDIVSSGHTPVLQQGNSLIYIRMEVQHETIADITGLPGNMTIERTATFLPRYVQTINFIE